MTVSRYDWKGNGKLAIIKQHSVAKHDVLRSYLIEYIQTLVVGPNQDSLRLTLVDGFAGGGVYQHETTRQIVLGSPFVFLQAAETAATLLNRERQKPLHMKLDYFFVERDADTCRSLERALIDEGYGTRIGIDIRVLHSAFETQLDPILQFIARKSPRSGRSIFLLDQYGYSDVQFS